ncbi:hypothetical protein ABES23_20165 [Peribacillus frigoritolerans]
MKRKEVYKTRQQGLPKDSNIIGAEGKKANRTKTMLATAKGKA